MGRNDNSCQLQQVREQCLQVRTDDLELVCTFDIFDRDAVIVGMGNCLTSFFAGFVIFGIIGYMAHELGVKVEDVAAQG